nr:unnamed protein product [Spirometra erinaceieuropaei]
MVISEEDKRSEKSMDWDVNPKKLFVSGLLEATEECDIYEYFSKFGIVTAVTVHKKTRKSGGLRSCFVAFRDTDAAKSVLESRPHVLHETEIAVSFARLSKSDDTGREKSLDWDVDPKRLFVGDLLEATEDRDLYEYFSTFGIVTEATVLKNTRRSDGRRCGFVVFRDTEAAERVLESQPHVLHETEITVSLARSNKSTDTGPRMRIGMSEEGASTSTPNTRTIYVGWLTPNTTEADLVAYFTKFGNVTNTEIKTDKFTKESRGFGFVTFEDNKAFENGVMEACHFLNGCRINVKPAKPYTHHAH